MDKTTQKYQRRTYTVTEAADLIGISRSTAYDLVSKGELRAIRLGRRWVVPVSTVVSIVGPELEEALAD
jgi:excisionase family DNA binding protein